MLTTIYTWIRNHIAYACWIRIGMVAIIATLTIGSCSSTSTTSGAPGTGWMFLKLAFAGLIWAAYAAREKQNLAWTFAGLAVLVFLVLLGKLDGLAAWGVLGFPIMAALGVWGYTKVGDGRMKSFLGFASGVIILFWMFLLYLGHSDKIKIGFLGALFPDDMAKIIFTVFLATFVFAIWKRSKFFYAVSFIALLSFLGNGVIDEMARRFPSKLIPATGGEISQRVGDLRDSAGKALKRMSKEWDNPTPKPAPAPTTAQPRTSYVPAPTTAPIAAQPVAPKPTTPQAETWNLRFYRGSQLFQQNVSMTRNGYDIFMQAQKDGTTFRGTLDGSGWFKGTVTGGGSPDGTFMLHIEDSQATGSLLSDEHIQFSMRRNG